MWLGVALTGIRYDSAFAGPFFAADNLEIRGILYTINPIAKVLEVAYFISLQRVRFTCAKVEDAMGGMVSLFGKMLVVFNQQEFAPREQRFFHFFEETVNLGIGKVVSPGKTGDNLVWVFAKVDIRNMGISSSAMILRAWSQKSSWMVGKAFNFLRVEVRESPIISGILREMVW